jgi:hypothetical protein
MQEKEDGTPDTDRLEKGLAENIDTKAAELIAGQDPSLHRLDLSGEQSALLALFMGLSLTRVPSFREGVRDLYSQIAQYTADLVAPKLWHGAGPAPVLHAEAKEWVSLEHMIEGAKQIANSLMVKEWQFFRSPADTLFITSDNPVVFSGIAPANPGSEVIMALTKHLAIVCTPKRTGTRYPVFDAPRRQVKSMNTTIARAARNRLFASERSEGLARLAKKYPNDEQKIAT